jgi:hypothetical protein
MPTYHMLKMFLTMVRLKIICNNILFFTKIKPCRPPRKGTVGIIGTVPAKLTNTNYKHKYTGEKTLFLNRRLPKLKWNDFRSCC